VGEFELVRCASCATVFTTRTPAVAEAEDYSVYYHEGNLEVPEFIERRLEEVVGEFDGYRTRGRWLDVGCGAGTLLRAARRCGWDAVGTEIAANAVGALRNDGFEVHLGELQALELESASFDVISLVEVVEHVPDPAALLAATTRLVRPGGAVYVTTPHGRGISARVLGTRWSAVVPPEHLSLVSVRGMRKLFERAGLRPRRVDTHAVNPRELADALFRRERLTGCARVEDAYALNQSLSERRSGRVLKAAVNRTLSATRLGDAMKAVAERPA
jgi:SAM-dependent methyltransferase